MALPLLRHLATACAFSSMRLRTIFMIPVCPSVVEGSHRAGGSSSSGVTRRLRTMMLLIGGLVLVLLWMMAVAMPRAKATEVGSCGDGNAAGALWLLDRIFPGISKVLRVGALDTPRL